MIGKNFSLLLALRYLNPVRTHVSVITLISLLGVALGVMVLIVVMSVMAGFEGLVKDRVLGQSPHILAERVVAWDAPDEDGNVVSAEEQWRKLEKDLEALPSVVSAYPLVEDFVIADFGGRVLPVRMQGVDTESGEAISDLRKLIKPGNGTADMGMGRVGDLGGADLEDALEEAEKVYGGGVGEVTPEGDVVPELDDLPEVKELFEDEGSEAGADDEDLSFGDVVPGAVEGETSEVCVVSSIFADNHGVVLGTILEVISNRNIKQLKPMLDRKGSASVYVQNKDFFDELLKVFGEGWKVDVEREEAAYSMTGSARERLAFILSENLREGERDLVEGLDELLKTKDFEGDLNFYPKGRLEEVLAQVAALKDVDAERLDDEEEMKFNELALPKNIRVVGIYTADRFAAGPQLLVPLHLAQELAGAGDTGGVNGIAMRLEDPYLAGQVLEEEVKPMLGEEWVPRTWMETHEEQFAIIQTQKTMMTVALSFIVLVAVFSIGAVMFTVTVQKKREIGVMKALGATPGQVSMVFTLQGVMVGFLGSLIGAGLSVLVLVNLDGVQRMFASIGFEPFPSSFYGVTSLPYRMDAWEMGVICVTAFVLCIVAAWGPAVLAARADAAKSLRNM